MKTLKYISSIIAATVIALGVVTYIQAKNGPSKVKSESIFQWYALNPQVGDPAPLPNPSQLTLASTSPMSSPPDATNSEACAQALNDGHYCAVLVEFASDATDFTLSGTSLADAISNNAKAIGVADGSGSEDEDGDGYARSPEPEDQ